MGRAWETQVNLPQNIQMFTPKSIYVSTISALKSVKKTQKGKLKREHSQSQP